MQSQLTIREPALLARYGLLEVCIKFALALEKSVGTIVRVQSDGGGVRGVQISAVYLSDSSNFHFESVSFALGLAYRLVNQYGETIRTGTGGQSRIWIKETGKVLASREDSLLPQYLEDFRGDIDTVVKALSAAIAKQLQNQIAKPPGQTTARLGQ